MDIIICNEVVDKETKDTSLIQGVFIYKAISLLKIDRKKFTISWNTQGEIHGI